MNALTIAPIGTCRIHTPLRRGAGRFPIQPVVSRNYGYVHTSAEALQQLRFMFGKQELPADIRKLAFRPGSSVDLDRKVHSKADLYLVELSSRKSLTVDGYPIQMNYMVRCFADFFADKARAGLFWSLAKENCIAERRETFERDIAFQRLSREDRELLARVLKHDMTDEELERDMRAIADLVGKDNLVFVTHVNADTPDNMPIEQRRKLISAVRGIAKRMEVPCYDPTPLMRHLGQADAMENSGLDLAHYTDLFADHLCEAWYTSYFARRVDVAAVPVEAPAGAGINEESIDHLDAMWRAGRVCDASRRVRQILRKNGDRSGYRLLLGRMQYELGDYEGAIAQLEATHSDSEPDERISLLLMQCYFETGEYRQAGRLASALIADERETPDILRIGAMTAEALGDMESALSNWKHLFRIAPDAEDAATAAARLMSESGDAESMVRWAHEVRAALHAHGPCFVILWNNGLDNEDREGLVELAREPIDLGEAELLSLVRLAADRGCATPAAVLAMTHGFARGNAKDKTWIDAKTSEWLDEGVAALAKDDLLQAADTIQACWQLNPNGNAVIRARRALERKMRQDVRAAFLAKDYQATTRILAIASQTLVSFPDFDSIRIRVAEALGDTETALRYLRRPLHVGEDVSDADWIKLARMAARSGNYGEAIDAYSQIISAKGSNDAARDEAKRQIRGLRSRAIRLARDHFAAGDYERGRTLLDRLPQLDPQEKKRVLSALHSKVKSLGPGSDAERLFIGETIIRLVPEDKTGLKAAATGAMRVHRFEQALEYWQTLRDRSSSPEPIDVNIRKCRMWIDREQRNKAA